MMSKNEEKKKKKKKKMSPKAKRRWRVVILILESLILLGFIAMMIGYVWYSQKSPEDKTKFKKDFIAEFTKCSAGRTLIGCIGEDAYNDKIRDKDFNDKNVKKNEGVISKEGYTNIALFGIDARGAEFDGATHSDTNIIVSINNKTGEVKMVSVYRDTYCAVSGNDGSVFYDRVNVGYFVNGGESAINTMNANLDLDITDYVAVNFSGLIKIIDALGGIDVNITQDEMLLINGYMVETSEITGVTSDYVYKSGAVHLNGLQATAYCRIRYASFTQEDGTVLNDDLGRTARQRFVLTQLLAKAKTAGTSQLMEIINSLMDYSDETERIIKTSLSFDEIMDLVPVVLDLNITEQVGFPYTYQGTMVGANSVLVPSGLEYNVSKLHNFLYEEKDYQPSENVQNISQYLINNTGIQPAVLPEDEPESETTVEEANEGYSSY